MNQIKAIATKELRGYFSSPVAVIFLGIFLSVTVFSFFWVEKFFARGLVDIRPMFEWLPLLLILLVSALSMRAWAEESKSGTIEVLLTLPVPLHLLVLGKFAAGLTLVGIALALTLPIPISVSMMGDLDWGPVLGGYLAAMLLACAYLSIGLCISSLTSNQIVALFGTGLLCGLLYLLGADALVEGRSLRVAGLLRSLGTGSRFESVARGVIDIRDLAYYGGLSALFLVLHLIVLRARAWGSGVVSRAQRQRTVVILALVVVNIVLLNIWLAPVRALRVDFTEDGLYSLSPITEDLVGSVTEELTIRAYISGTVHPKVDPLIPEIRDLLAEYAVLGNGNIRIEIINPDDDSALEEEAEKLYDIRPDEFTITTRKKRAAVRAYFRILVEYGDQHEVLGFDQILSIVPVDLENVEVKVGNLEYEITKAIKKVVYGFADLDAVFAAIGDTIELRAFVSSGLAQELEDGAKTIDEVAKEMVGESKGRMSYERLAPTSPDEQAQAQREFGIQPFRTLVPGDGGMQMQSFYYHLVLKVGNRAVLINTPEEVTPAKVRRSIEAAMEQSIPGFIKTIGLVTPPAPPPMDPRMQMQRPPPRPAQSFRALEQELRRSHVVQPVNLRQGPVDESIDVLILAGPENLDGTAQLAIDQFLMRGGAVIALVGKHRLDLDSQTLATEAVQSGLEDMFASYGVEIGDEIVLDETADLFLEVDPMRRRAVPAEQSFVFRIPRDGLGEHLTTTDIPGLMAYYASPLSVSDEKPEEKGAKPPSDDSTPTKRVEILASSTARAWLTPSAAIGGRNVSPPDDGASRRSYPLAVAITGGLRSHFADKRGESEGGRASQRILESSTNDARLVVIASSSVVADVPLEISGQLVQAGGARLFAHNLPFLLNLVDWAAEDTDLLQIRARAAGSRLLEIEATETSRWEAINYAIAFLSILAIATLGILRRRRLAAIPLVPREQAWESAKDIEQTPEEDNR